MQTTATALLRINFAYQFAFTTIAGTTVDFTHLREHGLRSTTGVCPMLDSLNALLLHGTMSASDARGHPHGAERSPSGHDTRI